MKDKLVEYAILTDNKKLKKYLELKKENKEKLYNLNDVVFYGVIAIFCTAILTMLMFFPVWVLF